MIEIFGVETSPAAIWLAAGFLLLLLEVSTGTLWLLWPGIAAIVFAAIAWFFPELGIGVQLLLYAGLAVLLTLAGDRYFKDRRAMGQSDRPNLNDRAAQLRGRRAVALGPFQNGYGAVRLDDSQWGARLETGDGADLSEGDPLVIRDLEGTVLIVARP